MRRDNHRVGGITIESSVVAGFVQFSCYKQIVRICDWSVSVMSG